MSSSRIVNRLGGKSLPTPTSPRATDSTAPTAPGTPVVASIVGSRVTITFTASTDAVGVAGYAAYLDGSPVEWATSSTNSITLDNLLPGSHAVAVRAFDSSWNLSAASAETQFAVVANVADAAEAEAEVNIPVVALARYRALPKSAARRIAWVGDSTTKHLFIQSVGGFPKIVGNDGTSYAETFAYLDGPFYNVNHGDFGENGQTLQNFVNGVAAFDVGDLVAFNPHLIVFSYGINDVRLGATSLLQLSNLLNQAVVMMQAAMPHADIILRMPNSLLYDAANTLTYIDSPTSRAKVQSYSDILREAYRGMIGQYRHCLVLDTQAGEGQIFPQTVQTQPGLYMASATDALHPIGEGYAAVVREICLATGEFGDTRYARHAARVKPMLPALPVASTTHASQVNASDYLVIPRICEDPAKYNLIVDGLYAAGAAGSYIDIAGNDGGVAKRLLGAVAANDIVVQYGVTSGVAGSQGESTEQGVTAWKLATLSAIAQGNSIRLISLPSGYPRGQKYPNPVRIYRPRPADQKYDADPRLALMLSKNDFSAAALELATQRAGAIGSISATAGTAPTTGGTIAVAVNGAVVETLTFAANATTATGGGSFAGLWLNEGDVVTATVASGFAGGAKLRIKLASV